MLTRRACVTHCLYSNATGRVHGKYVEYECPRGHLFWTAEKILP